MKVFESINNYYGELNQFSRETAGVMQAELRAIVEELASRRNSREATESYFDETIMHYRSGCFDWKSLVLALLTVLKEDKVSFSYIYFYLTEKVQGLYDVPLYRCPSDKEIQYAIEFDLDEIENKITQEEDPIVLINELLNKSRQFIAVRSDYKSKVEEALIILYEKHAQSAFPKKAPVVCDFLVSQEDAEEKMKSLHYIIDGKYGKDLAIAVCAAVDAGIISKSPSYNKLSAFFDVKGSSSGYEAYQNEFLGGKQIKGKDLASYQGYLQYLSTH